MKKIGLLMPLLVLLAGCNWVQLTDDGASVSLAGARHVTNCERLGRATARSLSRVATVERGSEKLQAELLTLARNEAADMGGDTIIPESLVNAGVQQFGVYRCG